MSFAINVNALLIQQTLFSCSTAITVHKKNYLIVRLSRRIFGEFELPIINGHTKNGVINRIERMNLK